MLSSFQILNKDCQAFNALWALQRLEVSLNNHKVAVYQTLREKAICLQYVGNCLGCKLANWLVDSSSKENCTVCYSSIRNLNSILHFCYLLCLDFLFSWEKISLCSIGCSRREGRFSATMSARSINIVIVPRLDYFLYNLQGKTILNEDVGIYIFKFSIWNVGTFTQIQF